MKKLISLSFICFVLNGCYVEQPMPAPHTVPVVIAPIYATSAPIVPVTVVEPVFAAPVHEYGPHIWRHY